MYILCTSSRYVLNGCSFSILRTTYVLAKLPAFGECYATLSALIVRLFTRVSVRPTHAAVEHKKKKNVWLKSAAELASKIQKNIYYNRKHTLRDMQRCTDGEHFAEKLKKITKRMKTKQNNNQNVQTTKTRDCQCR